MKGYFKVIFLLILIAIFSCEQSYVVKENQSVSRFDLENEVGFVRLKFSENSFAGQTKLSENSEIETGTYAKYNDGETSKFKIGLWKEHYENGKIKQEGRYLIGRYVECCFSGPCMRYYNYKVDKWKYFYENGDLELEGKYSIKKMWIDTNCGGDYLKYGVLNSNTNFYDQSGKRIKENIDSLKSKYEKGYIDAYTGYNLITLKENDTVVSYESMRR